MTTRLSNWVRSASSRLAIVSLPLAGAVGASAMTEAAECAPSAASRHLPLAGEELIRASSFASHAVTFAPLASSASTVASPRPREAVDRVMLAGEGPGRDHLQLQRARPASASTKLMIQKRITTVGSDQPRCSKWWWIGAIRNTRLPVRL